MRSILWPLMLLAAFLPGCATQPANNTSSTRTDPAPAASIDSFEGFAAAMEASIRSNKSALLLERLDTRRFARRSLNSLGMKTITNKTLTTYAGMLDTLLKQRFSDAFTSVKSARFVRLLPDESERPDEAVALFRLEPDDGGISYWKMYLRRANGRVSVTDWLNYSLGDMASHSLGDFALHIGTAIRQPDSSAAGKIKAYIAAAKSGKPQNRLDAYDQLPAPINENALLMFSYLQAANQISPDAYRVALGELAPVYRKQDGYALLLFEYHQINEEYDEAHRTLDRMAARTGEDAGLDSLHAGLALQTNDYKRAIAYARDGINREPAFLKNYWVLLDALVFSENYADAVLVLSILEEGFGYQFDAQQMATLEGYQTFAQSAPFKGWRTASSH